MPQCNPHVGDLHSHEALCTRHLHTYELYVLIGMYDSLEIATKNFNHLLSCGMHIVVTRVLGFNLVQVLILMILILCEWLLLLL